MNILASILENKNQLAVFMSLGLVLMGFMWVLNVVDPNPLKKILGGLDPRLAFIIALIIGCLIMQYFTNRGLFLVFSEEVYKGLRSALYLSFIFFLLIAIVDYFVPFSSDINVLYPKSLLFYPSIGFFVEIVFHLVPLFVIVFLLSSFKIVIDDPMLWVAFLILSLIEPAFQYWFSAEKGSVLKEVYVFLHIFFINVTSFYLFKRFDFVSMFSFRFFYYLFWHILWGSIRLKLFF